MPSGLLPQMFGQVHFQQKGHLVILLLPCFIEICVLNANSVDPDQMPQNAASDLGLHCLPVSLYGMLGINGLNCNDIYFIFQGDLMEMKIHADPEKANDDDCSLVSIYFSHTI